MSDAPMTPDELRARWAFAHPRERDAMVAEAMGERVKHSQWSSEPWTATETGLLVNVVPHYSTSWADAGPLLEELARKDELTLGWNEYWYVAGLEGTIGDPPSESAESLADAIALLYCLAKLETTP